MASTVPSIVSEEEIAAILAQPKFMTGDLDWNERPAGSRFLHAGSTLLNDTGATIPGLTAEFQYRRGSTVDCLYRFTVFSLKGNNKRRVYQIEVVPKDRKSHNGEDGPWFGPHQHYGERAIRFDPDPTLGCDDHEAWFNLFMAIANIQFSGKYLPPEPQPDLPFGS